jgi:amino acid adenylation domain-containing protein
MSDTSQPEPGSMLPPEQSNLTARQWLIYAGQRLHPQVLLYDAVYAVSWPGLEPQRFAEAWQRLTEDCDALRTVFEERHGIRCQRVLAPRRVEIEQIDLTGASGQTLDVWIQRRLRRPLKLAESVVDTALLRVSGHDYVWFLNIHHIIADAAAVEILISRLADLYAGRPEAALPLPAFADHVAAEPARWNSRQFKQAAEYWRRRLPRQPNIPLLYGVEAASVRQTRVVLNLDAALSARLTALARSLHDETVSVHAAAATLFAALLAVYLHRVSGEARVGIGATYHNRRTEQARRTVGLFIEILPLLVEIEPQSSLADVVRQLRGVSAEALRHRAYSVPNPRHAPAYSALLNYMRPLLAPPAGLKVRRVHPGFGAHAVSLSIVPPLEQGEYELWFDVNDEVASGSAQRAAPHFLSLLEAAVAEPHRAVASLPLLAPEELSALRRSLTGPVLEIATASAGCHAAFEARAKRTPAAVAVAFEGREVSYAELERRSHALAARLQALGARRGQFVGIHLERSPEMVITVLAVLKSGAAYLPLDPAYPPGWLRAMLDDAAPVVLVTTAQGSQSLPLHAARLLRIDRDDVDVERSQLRGDAAVSARDIAYLMYTSGSSGPPKGVLVTHGGVTNYLAWRTGYFPLAPGDRCLQKASLSFDDSVWEILEPLSVGACVVLARPRYEYDGAYLVRLMAAERITAACFVPSVLRVVAEEPGAGECRWLRRLTTGGEALSIALQRRVRERFPTATLYNGYGTVETTIASTFWKCIDEPGATSVPIGRPIANTEIHVLDTALQPLPAGVPGEICIGGAGVAQGYLNRRDLTAERFIVCAGRRLYRSGDRGRVRPDGVLEFIGRIDEQVKVRGVRVELGSIEAALADHPAVQAAAVVSSAARDGEQRLIACLVPREGWQLNLVELRESLRERLPHAMIPGRFHQLTELPLTPSGKLDRRALQASVQAEEERRPDPPANEIEARLLRLWEAVLEARPIGTRDDFFDLGGHSLAAVRLALAIEQALGRTLAPELLFEATTIEELARRISTGEDGYQESLVALSSEGSGVPLYLLHQIDGDVTRYRELAQLLRGRRPIYGLRVASPDAPPDRIEALASRYVAAVRRRQPRGPYALAGHSAGGFIALEMARLLRGAGERVALVALLDVDARMNTRSLRDKIRFHLEALRALPQRHRARYLWRNLPRWLGSLIRGAPVRVEGDRGVSLGRVRAAMERAVRVYQPRPYAGAVVLFRARERRVTGTYSRTLGWRRLARAGVRVIDVPGDHLTMLRAGVVTQLAEGIEECLRAEDAAETSRSE